MPEKSWYWIAPIVSDYVQKMDSLCAAYHITFRMIPSPVRIDRKNELENAIFLSIQSRESPILEFPVMKQYMNYINYADTILFRDNIHFKSDMIPQNYIQRFDQ